MKGLKLFLIVCLGFIGSQVANADDTDTARAATRRSASTTVASNRGDTTTTATRTNATSGVSRNTASGQNTTQSVSVRERGTTSARTGVVVRDVGTRKTVDTGTKSVSARTTSNVLPRTTSTPSSVVSVPARTATARTATTTNRAIRTATAPTTTARRNGAVSASRAATSVRAGATPTVAQNATRRNTSSATRISRAAITAEEIMNRDYTTCRQVFYDCMDEFCANKDSQLKRCACSARANDFDQIRSQLDAAEDKLLDFSQRLLVVNMDAEDAAAISQATEGELAFHQDDTSASKQLLDEIADKLNTTFDTSNFDANLAPISLSLNIDAAFDNLDPLSGTSTTAKSGTDLYNAALPVCREMAMEVCANEQELSIAESGYQMLIEQDCTTVARAYETQKSQTREQIRESSALLDMSRLDDYQTRNSDDILTCKSKMLDLLTNTSVCGENMEKCLDISGQYIDPSTGEAILTPNLANLANLITRPTGNQTWTSAPGNEKFVSYLNSKKIFLESATENCQDIADTVWDQFIDDALAQIKLAQDKKLEEVRQSCTTLTAQCLSDAAETLEDFDSRALSIFGIEADKTAKQMCSDIQNACTALLNTVDTEQNWATGVTEIATDKTYETILSTCREIGRNCIVQSCKSISGNFGLCESIDTSVNRKSIINRTACWAEVRDCVASAGLESIDKITAQLIDNGTINTENGAFYDVLYGPDLDIAVTPNDSSCITNADKDNCIYDICANDCGYDTAKEEYTLLNTDRCRTCRLAERIWGNCEAAPSADLRLPDAHNQIKIIDNSDNDTLMSWFAKNTNTDKEIDSCRDTSCGPGYQAMYDPDTNTISCVSANLLSGDNIQCPIDKFWRVNYGNEEIQNNCCKTTNGAAGGRDVFGNCCNNTLKDQIYYLIWNTAREDATKQYFAFTKSTYPEKEPDDIYFPDVDTIEPGKSAEGITGKIPGGGTGGGLCVPKDRAVTFVAAFKLKNPVDPENPEKNKDYYGTDGDQMYLICINEKTTGLGATGENKGDPNDTNAAYYPHGNTITCPGTGDGDIAGHFLFINATQGRYITPLYVVDEQNPDKQYTPYPTAYYNGADINSQCIQALDGTWSGDNCPITSPANYQVKYTETIQ